MKSVVLTILMMFVAGTHGLQVGLGGGARHAVANSRSSRSGTSALAMGNNPLDAMNREIGKGLIGDDDDVPMTKAEMREAAKAMKEEMAALKAEAAAAAEKAAADAKAAE